MAILIRNCLTCGYWCADLADVAPDAIVAAASKSAVIHGECRRHAPSPALNPVRHAYWPTTRDSDWCGDWKLNDQNMLHTLPLTLPMADRGTPPTSSTEASNGH